MKILIPLYFKPPPQSILFSLWEANSPFFCRMSLPDMQISVVLPNGSAALRAGCSGCAAFGGGDCRVPPRGHVLDLPLIARRFSIFRPAGRAPFYAPLRGAPDVPPSAAGIAGSRPGRRGTFFASKKVPKEGRQRTLRRVLWNLREYLAMTRRLPPLPTGTPAEGSIQVAGAPNDRSRIARQNPRRKTTPGTGVRALCARARRSRAVFRLPVGAARHAKAAVPPQSAL